MQGQTTIKTTDDENNSTKHNNTAVSVCDSECTFKAFVVSRKGDWVTLEMYGKTFRKKIHRDPRCGTEYVYALGNYSMAPAFN